MVKMAKRIAAMLLIILFLGGCTNGDDVSYRDDHLFFSGIKVGMSLEEAKNSVKDSGWFGDLLDITGGIRTNLIDNVSYPTENGDSAVPVAEFNEDGVVNIIGSVIQLSGKEDAEDAFLTYFDSFVEMYNLKDYEETVNETEPYLDGTGYIYAVSDDHKYEELGYETADECYYFWTDEENRVGYGFYKMFYTHSEDPVRYPDVYHIGCVMFNMNI